jgi:hypothetical protein
MPLEQHHKIEKKIKIEKLKRGGGGNKKQKIGKSKGVTISPVPGINRPPFLAR